MNRKKVQRLWREDGLRVPQRRRKRLRLGESSTPADRLTATRPDQVWALDYQFDLTANGRVLKILHVVDEFANRRPTWSATRSTPMGLNLWKRGFDWSRWMRWAPREANAADTRDHD